MCWGRERTRDSCQSILEDPEDLIHLFTYLFIQYTMESLLWVRCVQAIVEYKETEEKILPPEFHL